MVIFTLCRFWQRYIPKEGWSHSHTIPFILCIWLENGNLLQGWVVSIMIQFLFYETGIAHTTTIKKQETTLVGKQKGLNFQWFHQSLQWVCIILVHGALKMTNTGVLYLDFLIQEIWGEIRYQKCIWSLHMCLMCVPVVNHWFAC